jgi:type I restriction enzyme, S subunit
MNETIKAVTLGDIGKLLMCKRVLKSQTSNYGEIPFFKISTFGEKADTYISNELYTNYKEKFSHPKKGDILISAAGTVGKTVAYDGSPSYFQDSNIVWIDNDESIITNSYLYYFYQTEPWLTTSGSTIKRIYNENLRSLQIRYPDLFVQQKITKVLSDLDKKIELNNKINTELEAMAKLIYDYWFVQFDFPDANGKPYKSSGGKMVYNEALKREIPDGWSADYIENLLAKETRTKKLPKTQYLSDGAIPVIDQSTDFICGYTNDIDTVISTDVPRIVFGDHTRIVKLVNFDFARGADGTQVLLSNHRCVPQHFFYHSLLKIDLSNYGYARHFKFLKQTRIVIPNYEISNQFEGKIKSVHDQIKHNIFETNKLAELRDWLLPMLMNGQVTVKDA